MDTIQVYNKGLFKVIISCIVIAMFVFAILFASENQEVKRIKFNLEACNDLLKNELDKSVQRNYDIQEFARSCKDNNGTFDYYFKDGSNSIVEGIGCMFK